MSLTPQSNTSLEEIKQVLEWYQVIAICGHVNPDGDCLGAELALAHALRQQGKTVFTLLAKDDPVPHNLQFLPGSDQLLPASQFTGTIDCFVAVDVPTRERLGNAAAVQETAPVTITIDHHATDSSMAQYNYVDPDLPAASEAIWTLVKLMDAVNQSSALCALTGLVTDTGRFSYQNTTADAFLAASEMVYAGADPSLIAREFYQNRRLASVELEKVTLERMEFAADNAFVSSYLYLADFAQFNAEKADAEILVDELRSISGIRVALMLRESGGGTVRGSLRAKDDIDVAQVARQFNGGGHKAAAGFTYHGTLDDARKEVTEAVLSLCFGISDSMEL